jgi:hypothetical protein
MIGAPARTDGSSPQPGAVRKMRTARSANPDANTIERRASRRR